MGRTSIAACILWAVLAAATTASAQDTIMVTVDNFVRAESDKYFRQIVELAGGTGKFDHRREPMRIDNQTVIRANRDTLYSAAVFDLDAGPATVTLPDAGRRFMSMIVISQDEYTPAVFYGPGSHTFTKEQIGTRYVLIGIRTFVQPDDPDDVAKVHALQDAIEVEQADLGRFEIPNWDQASQTKVRDALILLAQTIPDSKRMFGSREQVDPVRHLVGAATGWGGNPEKDAAYLTVVPPKNDGATVYRLRVKEVPVDGFWSVTMYNEKGYIEPNQYDAYSVNNTTADKNADGSVTIQMGGCDGKIPNCLPTPPGWNYWVRLYQPRPEILEGRWRFPDAQPVQ
ncbi:MAG: DUF1254 domain-containing protein [Mesorhizobium sp.]|nr:MAG: DUF1254 domain-containing protein [Mesorhizobium sp.]